MCKASAVVFALFFFVLFSHFAVNQRIRHTQPTDFACDSAPCRFSLQSEGEDADSLSRSKLKTIPCSSILTSHKMTYHVIFISLIVHCKCAKVVHLLWRTVPLTFSTVSFTNFPTFWAPALTWSLTDSPPSSISWPTLRALLRAFSAAS